MEPQDGLVDSGSTLTPEIATVLKAEVVQELLGRLAKGEPVKRLAREYGVDRKTIRAWRARGRYQPRAPRPRRSRLDPHVEWITARAPEVDFNAAVIYRELVSHFGYTGSSQQVLRVVRPLRQRVISPKPNSQTGFGLTPGNVKVEGQSNILRSSWEAAAASAQLTRPRQLHARVRPQVGEPQ